MERKVTNMKTVSHIIPQDHQFKSKKVVPQPIHFDDYQINNFFRSVCHNSYLECAKQYVKFEQEQQYSVQDREHLRSFILQECKRIITPHDDGSTIENAVAEANMSFGYIHCVTGDRQLDLVMVAGFVADKIKELD